MLDQSVDYDFKDTTSLTRWVKGLIACQAVLAVAGIVVGLIEIGILEKLRSGDFSTHEEAVRMAETADSLLALVGLPQLLFFLVGGVLALKWIHRSCHNARQFSPESVTTTPGWSVGWYFIPIMNLWRPYQAMKEIWEASIPTSIQVKDATSILRSWWFLWIVSGAAGRAATRASLKAEELDELISASMATMLSDFLSVPLCVVFYILVARLYKMQQARHQEIVSNMNQPSETSEDSTLH